MSTDSSPSLPNADSHSTALEIEQLIASIKTKAIEIEALRSDSAAARTAIETSRESTQKALQDALVAKTQSESNRDATSKALEAVEGEQVRLIAETKRVNDLVIAATGDAKKITDLAAQTAAAKPTFDANVLSVTQGAQTIKTAVTAAEADRVKIAQLATDGTTAKVAAEAARDKATAAATAASSAQTTAESESNATTQLRVKADLGKSGAEAALAAAVVARDQVTAIKTAVDPIRVATEAAFASTKKAEADAKVSLEALQVKALEIDGMVATADRASTDLAQNAADSKSAAELAAASATLAMEAHNLSTTAGLAGAFNQKALLNTKRTNVWIGILIASLVAAAVIGWTRYTELEKYIALKPEPWALAAQVILALFGVGPPVWLAWVSTRMVSKSFALTEDYAYKAALSTAYVGFRDQAQKLGDPIFEQRLFAAAVTQLDANPVRLLTASHPGSPLQDLLQQPFMQDALENPAIRKGLSDWLADRFKTKAVFPVGANLAVTATPPPVANAVAATVLPTTAKVP